MAKNIRHTQRQAKKSAAKAPKKDKPVGANPLNKREPKTAKGRRLLKKREQGKPVEDPKESLILRGSPIKQEVTDLLKNLNDMKKPLSKLGNRKNKEYPFEDPSHIVDLCNKDDIGMFLFGSSTKKRPFRLLFGRIFNRQLLDMQEFKVSDFVAMGSRTFGNVELPVLGSKPMLVFQGPAFASGKMEAAKSLLMDFFRGASPEKVSLAHLETVITFTAQGEEEDCKIHFRQYRVGYSKAAKNSQAKGVSGESLNLPYCNLTEMGPRFTMELDRAQAAQPEILKEAMKVPKEAAPRKIKNIDTTVLGRKRGRIHLGRQDFDEIYTPHQGFEAQHARKNKKKAEDAAFKKKKPADGVKKTGDKVSKKKERQNFLA